MASETYSKWWAENSARILETDSIRQELTYKKRVARRIREIKKSVFTALPGSKTSLCQKD
jgi:hypothetical protein